MGPHISEAQSAKPKVPTAEQLLSAYKATKKMPPKFSIGTKLEMVCDKTAPVPSWVKSIPGPKYVLDTDKFKPRAPSWGFQPLESLEREKKLEAKKLAKSASAPGKLPTPEQMDAGWRAIQTQGPKYSLGLKPDMIPGDAVPSWVKSIPGPKYDPDLDKYKAKAPEHVIGTKLDMIIGGDVPSWVNSIPGPKYTYNTNDTRNRQPNYTIGEKLPTEGDIMSTRSPGPIYGGAAIDAVKQSTCDSTKRRTCAPGFGVGPRWSGTAYEMILSGAHGRFERGKNCF